MSAREFSKVSPLLWRSNRFMSLTDVGKVTYVYFITNAHVNSGGIYVLPDGYACADLRCSQEAYEETRAEIIGAGMLDHDPAHGVVLIERWFKHNPPMNDKHAKGTRKFIEEIDSPRLREKALAALQEADTARLERQAAKDAERAAARSKPGNFDTSNLLRTRLMSRA